MTLYQVGTYCNGCSRGRIPHPASIRVEGLLHIVICWYETPLTDEHPIWLYGRSLMVSSCNSFPMNTFASSFPIRPLLVWCPLIGAQPFPTSSTPHEANHTALAFTSSRQPPSNCFYRHSLLLVARMEGVRHNPCPSTR